MGYELRKRVFCHKLIRAGQRKKFERNLRKFCDFVFTKLKISQISSGETVYYENETFVPIRKSFFRKNPFNNFFTKKYLRNRIYEKISIVRFIF